MSDKMQEANRVPYDIPLELQAADECDQSAHEAVLAACLPVFAAATAEFQSQAHHSSWLSPAVRSAGSCCPRNSDDKSSSARVVSSIVGLISLS